MSTTSPHRRPALAGAFVVAALALSACGQSASGGTGSDDASGDTVTIETNNGEMAVPQGPQRVVVLDNTAMETISDFGISPVALPKPLLPAPFHEEWLADDDILDIGNHREPNLEIVSEAQPDLIIGGGRFEEYTDELERIAPVVDITPTDGDYIEGLRHQTEALGLIFAQEERAGDLVAELDEAVAAAAEATDGESVFLAVASGGKIDNGAGRIGRLIEPLSLVDIFTGEELDADSVHQDSGLAPETVAQLDPDWMIVLDRDAATTAAAEAQPARVLIDAQEAWTGTTFMSQDQIIVLDSYFYTREGIHAYTEAFRQIAEAFGA